MPAEPADLIIDPEFDVKLLNLVASLIGLYHWALFGSMESAMENAILYSALTGSVASSLALVLSFYQEDRNSSFEDMLQGIYSVLNFMAAFITFQKIKSCICYPTILNPVKVVFATSLICAVSMVGDIVSRFKVTETEIETEAEA